MNAVLAHLRRHVALSEAAAADFAALACSVRRHVRAGSELVRPDQPGKTLILIKGWIIREVTLHDGRRQVTALFLPGDILDFHADLIAECGYSLRAMTEVAVAELSRKDYQRLTAHNLALHDALIWQQLEQAANQTEWLVNLGQRSAAERLAHLFCEIFWRLKAVGLTNGNECDMPLTQAVLAAVTGMTPVHLSRSLNHLRACELVELRGKKLRITDGPALADFGLFDPGYLELKEDRPRPIGGMDRWLASIAV